MEDTPANLDDGELWLPSDVIRAVGVCRHHHRSPGNYHGYPTDLVAVDDLAQKLEAFGLLDRYRSMPSLKPLNVFPQNPEFLSKGRNVSILSPATGGFRVPSTRRVAAGSGTGAYLPIPRTFQRGKPEHAQVGMGMARVLQRKTQQSHGMNRFIPVRVGGSGRESGGTGVFLPRVYDVDSRKKGGQHLPSSEKMGLPQDWTY